MKKYFDNDGCFDEKNKITNLYAILELEQNCNKNDIKKAYKKMILKYHPDKNINKSTEKFLEIKYAYDILCDDKKKQLYDSMLNLNNVSVYDLNLTQILTKQEILLKNFINSTDINKFVCLLLKKKSEIKFFENLFLENISLKNKFFENMIRKIVDIDITINFTLTELWHGVSKIIIHERLSKNIFQEQIYPFDNLQIYENEGEQILFNNQIFNGNMIIKIDIIDTKINDEQYYIYENELYMIINSNRIINNKFKVKYIDGYNYKFNLDKLKQIEKNIGTVYIKKKFGLINNIDIEYFNNENIDDEHFFNNTFSHGNLYFIILI